MIIIYRFLVDLLQFSRRRVDPSDWHIHSVWCLPYITQVSSLQYLFDTYASKLVFVFSILDDDTETEIEFATTLETTFLSI